MEIIVKINNQDELKELIERANILGETINILSKEWIETIKKVQEFEIEYRVYKE